MKRQIAIVIGTRPEAIKLNSPVSRNAEVCDYKTCAYLNRATQGNAVPNI